MRFSIKSIYAITVDDIYLKEQKQNKEHNTPTVMALRALTALLLSD